LIQLLLLSYKSRNLVCKKDELLTISVKKLYLLDNRLEIFYILVVFYTSNLK